MNSHSLFCPRISSPLQLSYFFCGNENLSFCPMITCAKYLKYKNCDYYKLQIYLSNISIEINCSNKMTFINVYAMKLSISSKSKSKCQVFILCLIGEIKRMLTSIIFAVTSDQVKINRSISNSIKGRRIYRSVRFPINQKYDVKMAKQFNDVLYKWNKKKVVLGLHTKILFTIIFTKNLIGL